MKLKIRTEIHGLPKMKSASQEEQDLLYHEFMSKSYIKFSITIQKTSKHSDEWYLMDIQHIKGCWSNFMELAGRI